MTSKVENLVKQFKGLSGCEAEAFIRAALPEMMLIASSNDVLEHVDDNELLDEITGNNERDAREILIGLFRAFTPVEDDHLVKQMKSLLSQAELEVDND